MSHIWHVVSRFCRFPAQLYTAIRVQLSAWASMMAAPRWILDNKYGMKCEGHSVWKPMTLPDPKLYPNVDGRPAWEPPALVLDHLIGEDGMERRKALMEHFGGDIVKVTRFLDLDDEIEFMGAYWEWVTDNKALHGVFEKDGDSYRDLEPEKTQFWRGLSDALERDAEEVDYDWEKLGCFMWKDDGKWIIEGGTEYPAPIYIRPEPEHSPFGSDNENGSPHGKSPLVGPKTDKNEDEAVQYASANHSAALENDLLLPPLPKTNPQAMPLALRLISSIAWTNEQQDDFDVTVERGSVTTMRPGLRMTFPLPNFIKPGDIDELD